MYETSNGSDGVFDMIGEPNTDGIVWTCYISKMNHLQKLYNFFNSCIS